MTPSPQVLRSRIERYRDQPETETSGSAVIARELLSGGVIDEAWLIANLGDASVTTRSLLGSVITLFRTAGWDVLRERPPGPRGKGRNKGQIASAQLRSVSPRSLPAPRAVAPQRIKPRRQANPIERSPYAQQSATRPSAPRAVRSVDQAPGLGQTLKVRALALDAEDQVMVQLSDGNGAGWQAVIVGYVER